MRLDKFIATATALSRSQARHHIKAGSVNIAGTIIQEAGYRVNDETVFLHGKRLNLPQARYLMLHKPAGYVCATTDNLHPTVLDLINEPLKHSLQIIGRLDRDTTGLVLITDDGQWNHRISSPKYACQKYYSVTVEHKLTSELIPLFAAGIQLEREKKPTRPATLKIIDDFHADVSIAEGKYHQVKRMFAALNNRVLQLHRHKIGRIVLDKDLQCGQYRPLTAAEASANVS